MTSRIVKITSRQNQIITSSKNLVDFDLPSGTYDLSKSYINLNVSLDSHDQDNISLLSLARNTEAQLESNTDFIKNCSLKSQTRGVIENIRNVNILKKNQKLYEETGSHCLSSQVISKMGSVKDLNNLASSPYRDIEKLGTVKSKDRSHDHIIRLKELMNFCKNSYYDTDEKGDLKLHLEIETTGFDTVQALKADDGLWNKSTDGTNNYKDMVDAVGAGVLTTLTTKRKYFNIDESPFYVGQQLVISSPQLTGTPVSKTITSITQLATYALELTLSSSITMTGAGAITATSATEPDVGGVLIPTPTFNSCELVLVEVDKREGGNDYQYTSYALQEDTVATTALNKNYMLGKMTKNVFVITPSDSQRFMSNSVVSSYRTSVDNVFQQNRPILFGDTRDPLHITQIMKTYDNMDTKLSNLNGTAYQLNQNIEQSDPAIQQKKSYMVMAPVDNLGKEKMFGLELNGPVAFGRVLIFEEFIKML
jgi:hypothetical protein